MKFLHEMIARKRQAQSEALEAPEPVALAESFDLPEMSAVSPEATPVSSTEGEDLTASIIPYRQRQSQDDLTDGEPEQSGFAPQATGYDWDVSEIDLSSERSAAGMNGEVSTDHAQDEVPTETDNEPAAAEMLRPESESAGAQDVQTIEPLDHADQEPEDEPAHPASSLAGLDEVGEEMPKKEASEPPVEDLAASDTAVNGDEIGAEETDMSQPESTAEEPVLRHKSAAEAAASLARQVQQRKIWDIQPPASDDDEEQEDVPAPFAEAAPEPVADLAQEPDADPVADPGTEPDDLAEFEPEQVAVQAAPTLDSEVPAEEEPTALDANDNDEFVPEEPESQAADTGVEDVAPARRRTGRVKTRLLGFHKHDEDGVDPISAAAQSPTGQARFPVGWMVVLEGPGRGASFTLTAGASKIGRGEDQAVRLDFGDNSISRDNHAVVAYDDEQRRFFIGHGGKANLVRLNDMPVLSTEPLTGGDTIRIGETTLLFTALCGPDFSWDDENVDTADAASR